MAKNETRVAVTIVRDYWTAKEEAFSAGEGNPFPPETRLLAGMEVEMTQARAFALANSGVVNLVIPGGDPE